MEERLPLVLEHVRSLGYAVFTEGRYNLNIVGLRSIDPSAGRFDDRLAVAYRDADGWTVRYWPITTDPGRHYLEDPSKALGPDGTTAILVPGQYRGAYQIGPHGRTKYDALVQWGGEVRVYRDGSLDAILDHDESTIAEGYFGINIHASSMDPYHGSTDRTGSKVGAWSAGCQVFARDADFRAFMMLARRSSEIYGNRFTYTLVDEPILG